MKVSVIIPLYNVEKYLSQCIDSIINQTYKDIEVILVDDGSTDKSPQICDQYTHVDDRIKVIHKDNGGQSSARNRGLEIATGDYISFVDSDDWLHPLMYEKLVQAAGTLGADVVSCYPVFVIDGKVIERKQTGNCSTIETKQDIFDKLNSPDLRFEVWNKIYKKKLLDNIRFEEGRIYEELLFDRFVFLNVNMVAVVDFNGYYYRINRPGSTNSFFKDSRFYYFEEMDNYISFFEGLGWDKLKEKYLHTVADNCITFYLSAFELNATKEQRNKLVLLYKMYYSQLRSIKANLGLKKKFFKTAPFIYVVLSKLKNHL